MELPAGAALRTLWRQPPRDDDPSGLVTTCLDLHVAVPSSPRVLVLQFRTPLEPLADVLVDVFDAIAGTLRWPRGALWITSPAGPGTVNLRRHRRERRVGMGDRLRVDLGQLEDAGRSLDTLGDEFQRAGNLVDDARTAVGHDRLATRLASFADGWKVRREDLLEDMSHLAEMTQEAVRTYREVDAQLAAACEGDAG